MIRIFIWFLIDSLFHVVALSLRYGPLEIWLCSYECDRQMSSTVILIDRLNPVFYGSVALQTIYWVADDYEVGSWSKLVDEIDSRVDTCYIYKLDLDCLIIEIKFFCIFVES